MKPFVIILLFACLASCSAEQAFYGAQSMERDRCVKGPANDYRQCLERNSMSYEEYEAARSKADEDG